MVKTVQNFIHFSLNRGRVKVDSRPKLPFLWTTVYSRDSRRRVYWSPNLRHSPFPPLNMFGHIERWMWKRCKPSIYAADTAVYTWHTIYCRPTGVSN